MTKRTLYASAQPGVSALATAAILLASPLALRALGQEAACATCVAVTLSADQAMSLPMELGGMEVLVRVAPDAERGAIDAMKLIESRGGRPGLFITALPDSSPDAAALSQARRVVIAVAPPGTAQTADEYAFSLKTRLTAVRGAAPGTTTIGLAADRPTLTLVLARELGSYVDFVVIDGNAPFDAPGTEIWRTIASPAASVQTVLSLTKTAPEITHWLWELPQDPTTAEALVAELARVAALPAGVEPSQAAAGEHVGESVDVVGTRSLTVDEIIARHQAATARQAALVHDIVSSGTMTLTFEAPGFPAPVSIGADTTIYTGGGRTEIEQREIRVNGIAFGGRTLPRLPIIEPERVASPPLAIELTNRYRYRLAGRDTVGGTPCYVVAFEPDPKRPGTGEPLFRGQACIATDSFAMLKVSAAQTGLRGPIVKSEQTDEFRQVQPGVWLLARSDIRQMYEGAAHRTPIHRVLEIRRTDVNPSDFKERRNRAYADAPVMLRDTPQGFRYLKKGTEPGKEAPDVAQRSDRVRTLIGGVIIDPNISTPLPFAGVSYVDFNLFKTGTQFSGFFGGTYGQLAFSVPSLGGSRWQLAGQAFAIASSYNDRAFDNGREIYEEDIHQRPSSASVWVLRPLTARVSVRAGYDLDYTHLSRGDQTASDFVVPADQVVHGLRVSLDLQRAGWNASAWWNPARRTGWHAWGRGRPGEYDSSQRDFERYGASVARSTVFGPRLVGRAEAAWMDGNDLDRFSRYSFGTFDNRLRGYPSALIRYDRGGVVRTALAWSAAKLVRIDGFLDAAWAHDPGFGRGLRNYTGVGAAVEAPAPFGTLVAIEWGYGFRGVNTNGSLGTQVLRISAVKVF
jgi:hypothetical protein